MLAAEFGHTETVLALLTSNDINQQDQDSMTALMIAAGYGHTKTVQALLTANDIIVIHQDNKGKMALIFAIANGHTETILALLSFTTISTETFFGYLRSLLMRDNRDLTLFCLR